jgi:adenine phosphoribosyltransferase
MFSMFDFKSFVQEGKGRADLSSLYRDHEAFVAAVHRMSEPFKEDKIHLVAAIDALGFVFGTAVANELNAGLILVRKGDKVSVESDQVSFVDYSKKEKSFEIARSVVKTGQRVLIVDDWSETGTQLKAAILLLQKQNAEVIGVSCFNIDASVRNDSTLANYKLQSVL